MLLTHSPIPSALAALGTVALLSCGPSRDAGSDLSAVDPADQDVLIWYTYDGARESALTTMVARFNETNEHGIRVHGEHIGGHEELYHMMHVGIQGGPLPQIVEAYQNQARAYHKAGAIVDLEPYMSSATWGLSAQERDDFIPEFLRQDNVDGVQTALLPNRSMEVLYYNQQWLDELGFDGPPADWSSFAAMCTAARDRPFSGAAGGRSLGILWERDASRLASIVYSLSGDIMDAARTRYTFDTPATRQALTMVRDLVRSGAAGLTDDNGDRDAFGAGEVLFAQRSSAGVADFSRGIGDRFVWHVAGLPTGGDRPMQNVYGASLAILRSTPEQQLASWLFIKWFTQESQQTEWATATGYFPVRRSVAHRLGPDFRVAYNLLQDGRPEPSVGGYEPVRALVVEALAAIVDGADMAATLARLDADANQTLVPYR